MNVTIQTMKWWMDESRFRNLRSSGNEKKPSYRSAPNIQDGFFRTKTSCEACTEMILLRLDLYCSNVHQQDHCSSCLQKRFIMILRMISLSVVFVFDPSFHFPCATDTWFVTATRTNFQAPPIFLNLMQQFKNKIIIMSLKFVF